MILSGKFNYIRAILLVVSFHLCFVTGCAVIHGVAGKTIYEYGPDRGYDPLGGYKIPFLISVSNSNGECWLLVSGPISWDTPRAFKKAAEDFDKRKCETRWVLLNSPGGNVKAAMDIGYLIRSRGYNTSLYLAGGKCASACGLLFIAGVQRAIPSEIFLKDSLIGFHQISKIGRDGKKICIPADHVTSSIFLFFAKEMLPNAAAEIFHQYAMETDCSDITFVGPQKLIDVGIATTNSGIKIRLF